MAKWLRVTEDSTGEVILPKLKQASNFWERFRGLQLSKPLPPEQGLLLTPCRSLHTHWMRFSIDVIWLDRDQNVVDIRRNVRPWRFVFGPKNAHAAIETTAGSLVPMAVGTTLNWDEANGP